MLEMSSIYTYYSIKYSVKVRGKVLRVCVCVCVCARVCMELHLNSRGDGLVHVRPTVE